MKTFDIFTDMKNEDRKFGEKAAKQIEAKRPKHRNQDFSRMSVNDIRSMSDDFDYEDDYEMA